MPSAPLRYCSVPGCPEKVNGQKRCPTHALPSRGAHGWRSYPEARIRGEKLQKMRAALFAEEPFCRLCKEQGRKRLATIRDHIVPLAEGGTDEPMNIQGICEEHHREKTKAEARRGMQRAR